MELLESILATLAQNGCVLHWRMGNLGLFLKGGHELNPVWVFRRDPFHLDVFLFQQIQIFLNL